MVESPTSSAAGARPAIPGASLDPERSAWGARGAWRMLVLLMLLSFTNQFHRISLAVLDVDILRDHQMSEESMGALKSVFLYSYTLLMAAGGWLADRVGTRATLLLVAVGSGLFGGMCGLTGVLALAPAAAWWWIASARGLMGVASAPLYPSTARTVASWFARHRQELANALVTTAAPIGFAVAWWVLPMLKDSSLGWRGAFLVSGVATTAVVILWAFLGRSHPPINESPGSPRPPTLAGRPSRSSSGIWLRFFKNRSILALTMSYATVGYFEYLLFYWLGYYFNEILKLPKESQWIYNQMPNLAMIIIWPLGGWLCGRLVVRIGVRRGYRIFPAGCMVLAAALLAAGALVQHLPTKVTLLSLALGAIGATEGSFWTAAIRLGGPLGATSGGFVNTGGNLLGSLAPHATPVIAGWVNRSSMGEGPENPLLGWTVALLVGSAVTLAGAVFWRWVDMEGGLKEEG